MRQILRGHRPAKFLLLSACCFVVFDTYNLPVLVYCFGSFLLQDMFSSLLVFAFERQNMAFTANELLTCILNGDTGLFGYDYNYLQVQ